MGASGVLAGGKGAAPKAAALAQTEPCDDSVEPNCQQYQATNHQLVRGTNTPFAHYKPATYAPGKGGSYYNPLAASGVYLTPGAGKKAAALMQVATEPCDDSIEPNCQQYQATNHQLIRGTNTPFAHYKPATYAPGKGKGGYYNPMSSSGVLAGGKGVRAQLEKSTEPCNDAVEPLCQQTDPTKHQLVRGTNKPFEHYHPKTYGGPPGGYYNPLAKAGVYAGPNKPVAKAAKFAEVDEDMDAFEIAEARAEMEQEMESDDEAEEMTEPCDDSVEPNCQQYQATNHQLVRGTNKPFEHYTATTYNPGKVGKYYNPLASAGVYNGAKPKAGALAQESGLPACAPALELTQKELDLQMESFSRTFDKQFYSNAWKIYSEL